MEPTNIIRIYSNGYSFDIDLKENIVEVYNGCMFEKSVSLGMNCDLENVALYEKVMKKDYDTELIKTDLKMNF